MGYGYYVVDGRPAGYGVLATCDRRGCNEEIDRGLAYLCGTDPGRFGERGCGRYYCDKHLGYVGPRGGCKHRGDHEWGDTLSCMEPDEDGVVCLYRKGHFEPHAWALGELEW